MVIKTSAEQTIERAIETLKNNGFNFIENYQNGEDGFWGFDEMRDFEITIKINSCPDEESIENFEEHLREIDFSNTLNEEKAQELIKSKI